MTDQRRTADDFVRDMKAKQHTTPGDIDRKERIAANARDALRRLKSNQTYEDWRMVGHQMMVVTEEVMNGLALDEWDGNNKQLVREFTKRFEGWEHSVSNAKPLTKQERWALREIMTNPVFHSWYSTELTGPEQRRLHHPNAIINRYKAKHPDPNKAKQPPRQPSPALSPALAARDKRIAELEAHQTELQEELEAARSAPRAEAQPQPVPTDGAAAQEIAALKKELAQAKAALSHERMERAADAQDFRDEVKRRAKSPKAAKAPLPPDEERDRIIKGLRTRLRNVTAELHDVREWVRDGAHSGMNFATMSAIAKCLHPDHKPNEAQRAEACRLFTSWKADKDKAQRKAR